MIHFATPARPTASVFRNARVQGCFLMGSLVKNNKSAFFEDATAPAALQVIGVQAATSWLEYDELAVRTRLYPRRDRVKALL
jgi:hypothetical protein